MEYRTAKVIDNNDKDKKGKVQVQILPEFNNVLDPSILHWAKPYYDKAGGSMSAGEHNPPEKDSYIKVIIEDKYWKEVFYLDEEYIDGNNSYQLLDQWSSMFPDMQTPVYPNPRFTKYKEGTVVFRNSETGELGLLHKSGTYIYFDDQGKIKIDSLGQDIEIKCNNAKIEATADAGIKCNNALIESTIDTEIKCVNANINASAEIKLGGDSATNSVVFNGTGLNLSSLLTFLVAHVHDSPQAPTGTLVTAPPTGGSAFSAVPDTCYSNTVKTKS